MRPAKPSQFGLGRGAKPKGRPIQGNSPNDRLLRGPGCNRPKRICADFFPACSLTPLTILRALRMRFFRHHGIYRSDVVNKTIKTWGGVPPPVGRPRAPVQGRDGRNCAPFSSSAMSSGRLFLDRVARQQSPSPLHRQPQNNTHPSGDRAKGDISTLPARGHFYFALTLPVGRVDNPLQFCIVLACGFWGIQV